MYVLEKKTIIGVLGIEQISQCNLFCLPKSELLIFLRIKTGGLIRLGHVSFHEV